MRKINWKIERSEAFWTAKVGNIVLRCWVYTTIKTSKRRWEADVSIQKRKGTFRRGPLRQGPYALSKAKEDAVRLARELLLDHKASLDIEMAKFDLVE